MTMTVEAGQAKKQLVVFDLASQAYGVDIGAVREIIPLQEITRVPTTPEFIEGVINLRGKVIPVVDLRRRLGLPSGEENKENRIVVIDVGGQDIGTVVDAVTEVIRISTESVEMPSSPITSADSEYLMGIAKIDDRLIILLDLESVLPSPPRSPLSCSS